MAHYIAQGQAITLAGNDVILSCLGGGKNRQYEWRHCVTLNYFLVLNTDMGSDLKSCMQPCKLGGH